MWSLVDRLHDKEFIFLENDREKSGRGEGVGGGGVSSLSSKKYKGCSWTFDWMVSVFPIQTTLKREVERFFFS